MLPNFLIIGAEKSGTTWLYTKLKNHPDIFLPETKEISFFNKYNSKLYENDHFERLGLHWYQSWFRTYEGQKAIGEVSPMYICDQQAPSRIKDVLPEVKIIALLRNPVNRAYSHYWMARWKKNIDLSFDNIVKSKAQPFITRGLYYEQLSRYYKLFPSNNILILIYEQVFDLPLLALEKVFTLLGVDKKRYLPNIIERKINPAGGYRNLFLYNLSVSLSDKLSRKRTTQYIYNIIKTSGIPNYLKKLNRKKIVYPKMEEKHKEELYSYFRNDIDELEKLIGVKLDIWRKI